MASHTPGPWFQLLDNTPGQRQRHIVRSAAGLVEVARASEIYMDRAEREANARLIAAAPDMLAALKQAAEALDATILPLRNDGADGAASDAEVARDAARALIAKAKG